MEDRPDIQLSAAEHQCIFETDVVPYLLGTSAEPLVSSAHPVMVIVGGQPGAGKSRSMDSVRLDLEGQGGVMEIAADELRKFHPQYAALMREDDRLAADLTHADASGWADKAESFAREQRLNVLLEATLKTPENVVGKLAAYRDAGYFVEVRVIAVHERSSWQGVLCRYEQQKADAGAGRMTPRAVHDAAVRGVVAAVERVEAEGLADRVRVDRRGAELIYTNSLRQPALAPTERESSGPDPGRLTGTMTHPPSAADAIRAERERPWSAQQWDDHVAGFDRILALQGRRGRNPATEEMQEVQALREAAARQRDRSVLRERDHEVARSFATDPPALAQARHPRLAGAYAVMTLVESQAAALGMGDAALALVCDRTRENIVRCIAAGEYPSVPVARRASEKATDREPTRKAHDQERVR